MRWSQAGLDVELRRLSPAARGIEDAPPNLSILVGDRRGGAQSKHQLYVQGQLSSSPSSEGTLLRSVVRALGTLAHPSPEDATLIRALLLVASDGTVTVVDRRLASDVRRLEPRLRRSGHRVLDLPHVHVRHDSATAVLADSAASLGIARERLDERWPPGATDDDLGAGDVEISRLVYQGRPLPESLATAVADMVPLVWDAGRRVRTSDVERLAALAGHVEAVAVLGQDRAALRSALGLT